jgi:hypothetical protein
MRYALLTYTEVATAVPAAWYGTVEVRPVR